MDSWFFRIYLIYDLCDFPENGQTENEYSEYVLKNVLKYVLKNPRIQLIYHFCVFFLLKIA